MTIKGAYHVLGLTAGASAGDIRAAHRRLMMKLHPDQGGSTYFASRINEAREVLLKRPQGQDLLTEPKDNGCRYRADHTPVIHVRKATRPGEKGFNALKLSLGQPELIRHRQVLLPHLNYDVTSDGIRVCKGLLCGQTDMERDPLQSR